MWSFCTFERKHSLLQACMCMCASGGEGLTPRLTAWVKYSLGVWVSHTSDAMFSHLDSVWKSQTWLLLFYSLVFPAAEVHTQLRMSKMSNPVITHQPGSGGYGTNVQTGEWSTGLCSCCTDFFVCECWLNCFKLWFLLHLVSQGPILCMQVLLAASAPWF